jgi:alpha-L-fucosidase
MNRKLNLAVAAVSVLLILSCHQKGHYYPATKKTEVPGEWELLKFGAFVHFNDNSCIGTELSKNADPGIFNPVKLNFDTVLSVFQQAGIKYAVLTTRHTSGFCLWDSKHTRFDAVESPFRKDVVHMFVEACRKYDVKPCFYYCMWGRNWHPWEWNPLIKQELEGTTPKKIILGQLTELAENYGEIYAFWLDMQFWADSTLSAQETYDLLKSKNPSTLVHFNQHVQDGGDIRYFPTDIVNGEERLPPPGGHVPERNFQDKIFYLPFEYEITSQRCDSLSLGNGLMSGSVWFTYPESRFYPVDSLYKYIRMSFERGGSNVLLSTAPDKTGLYRKADRDSLLKLGRKISLGLGVGPEDK